MGEKADSFASILGSLRKSREGVRRGVFAPPRLTSWGSLSYNLQSSNLINIPFVPDDEF